VVRKLFLLLLFIPVLGMAGGQVWREACAGPGDTTLPGIVVDLAPSAHPTSAAPRPLPPPSGFIVVNR
jgi:hypothetical protein